jgi:hypothetical protein
MTLREEMRLPNGLVAEVWDRSRTIAADTNSVVVIVRIPVVVKEEYFDDSSAYRKTVSKFGSPIVFEYRNERTFVLTDQREIVFGELLGGFRKDVLPYISKEHFPKRFILSKYREMMKDSWKYPDQM